MKTTSIFASDFVNVMNSITGCQMCNLSYTTDIDHINKKLAGGKSNPYYGRVSSLTTLSNIQFNANYGNAVNNRLPKDAEEKFEPNSLPWGEWLVPNKSITHKGATYLRLYRVKNTESDVTYILDGKIVTDPATISDIDAAFRPAKESNTQAALGIKAENQVKPFALNVADIIHCNIDGKKMVVVHEPAYAMAMAY